MLLSKFPNVLQLGKKPRMIRTSTDMNEILRSWKVKPGLLYAIGAFPYSENGKVSLQLGGVQRPFMFVRPNTVEEYEGKAAPFLPTDKEYFGAIPAVTGDKLRSMLERLKETAIRVVESDIFFDSPTKYGEVHLLHREMIGRRVTKNGRLVVAAKVRYGMEDSYAAKFLSEITMDAQDIWEQYWYPAP